MIEGLLIGALCGLAVGILLGLCFGNVVNDRVIEHLEGERDRALAEAKAFRNLVVPALGRAERLQGLTQAQIDLAAKPAIALPTEGTGAGMTIPQAKAPAKAPAAPVVPIGKMSFRRRFNFVRRQSNSKQLRTDALAKALGSQKVPAQEKTQ